MQQHIKKEDGESIREWKVLSSDLFEVYGVGREKNSYSDNKRAKQDLRLTECRRECAAGAAGGFTDATYSKSVSLAVQLQCEDLLVKIQLEGKKNEHLAH